MTYNIANVIRQKQSESPMRSYLWRVVLPDLTLNFNKPSAVYGDGADSATELFGENTNINVDLSTRITNITIPFSTIETDKAIVGNSFWYYAKQNDIGTISFEMHEFEDGRTLQYLTAWQDLMGNSNGTYNAPNIYKQEVKFYRLSSNKQDLVVHTYAGYFVSGIADLSNDYESNDIVKYAVNLTGDSVSHETFSLEGVKTVGKKVNTLNDLGTVLDVVNIIGGSGNLTLPL